MRREAGLVAYRALSDVVGKAAFFLVTVAAARRLSQGAFGVFSLASTLGWMAAVLTDFGIQLHLARAVAKRPTEATHLLRLWFNVRLWTAATALALVAAGLGLTDTARPFALAVFLFVLVYLVNGLVEFLHYFYRGLSRTDIESTLTLYQRFATLGVALAVLSWQPSLTGLAWAMVLPAVATFAYSSLRANALARVASSSTASRGSEAASRWIEFKRDVFPLGVGIVLSALYFRIDVFLVEWWNGAGSVALYNAVFRLVEALRLVPAAVLAVALPVLCRATTIQPLVRVSSAVTAFAVVVTMALWTSAGWLIPFVYGASYAEAVPAFRVLLLAFPLMSLNYALTHQLIGWNGHRAYAAVCAGALVFNVALNARLIPQLSIVGAAWTTVWTEMLLTLGCGAALWRMRQADARVEPSVVLGVL